MNRAQDLTGFMFGKLTVVERAENVKDGKSRWLCRCECGNEKIILGDSLKSGKTTSCGCIRKEMLHDRCFKDLTGMTFGKYKVLRIGHTDKNKKIHWVCRCECGNIREVNSSNLINGKSLQCVDCGYVDVSEKNTKHGDCGNRLHNIYMGMKNRCLNVNNYSYKHYGERGISVCDEWLGRSGYERFKLWSLLNGYEENLSIDRIDVDKNYCPDNCRWVDIDTQSTNKTNTRYETLNGETKAVSKWAKQYEINYSTLISRINKGIPIEKAVLP